MYEMPIYYINDRFEEIMTEAATYTDGNRLIKLLTEARNILTEQDPRCIFDRQLLW